MSETFVPEARAARDRAGGSRLRSPRASWRMWITGKGGGAKLFRACGKSKRAGSYSAARSPSHGFAVTSIALTYLPVSANFTDLYPSCRRYWLVRSDRTWSSHGEAHLPPAQHAACEDARFPCPDGDEVGPRDAGASPEEGSQAAHRPYPGQVRRSLGRLRRRSASRVMHGSRGARSCS